jgi:hypothetical protein
MMINLVGPACAGKSTIAGHCERMGVRALSIDGYRKANKSEHAAFYMLGRDAMAANPVIIESSGLSRRLRPYVLDAALRVNRSVTDVIVTARREVLLERLALRADMPAAPYGKDRGIESLIDACMQKLRRKYPQALCIDTTYCKSEQDTVKAFCSSSVFERIKGAA